MRWGWALAASAVLALSACSSAGTGDDDQVVRNESRYVAAANQLRTIAIEDRGPAPELQGMLLGGGTFDLTEQRGKVVVLNVWGSWCPPCRAEAPTLEQAWRDLASQGVQFVGINTRDGEATARVRTPLRHHLSERRGQRGQAARIFRCRQSGGHPEHIGARSKRSRCRCYSGEVTVAKLHDMITPVIAEPAA